MDIEAGPVCEQPHRKVASGGIRVCFRDVSFEAQSKGQRLLSSVSAYADPCQMTALMGPSGSGKTTLLDVLAGCKTSGTVSGVIKFGGATPSQAFLRRYTGYVEQFDTLIGTLTVKEMLMYTAELKRSMSEPYSSKLEAVQLLMKRLGLLPCQDVPVGNALTKGISGGQAKRTNIGVALISDPCVLFLDEPTSGLDSYSANEVVQLVWSLAREEGTTVVATIHSPTAAAFAMFHRVLVLVRGKTVYFGPQGAAAIQFARQHWLPSSAGDSDAAADANPAEMLVDIVTEAERNDRDEELANTYAQSELFRENDGQIRIYLDEALTPSLPSCSQGPSVTSSSQWTSSSRFHVEALVRLAAGSEQELRGCSKPNKPGPHFKSSSVAPAPHVSLPVSLPASPTQSVLPTLAASSPVATSQPETTWVTDQLSTQQPTATPWYWALWVLIKYRSLVNFKSLLWILPRFADKLMFAFVITTVYLRTGTDFSVDNIINLSLALCMWCVLPAFGAVTYMPSIVLERALFYRERADGLYYVGTYFAAKLIEELFVATVFSLGFSAMVYYGVGFVGSFALFWVVYLLTLANGVTLGYVVAAISPNMDIANALLPAYVVTLLFFAGQLKTLDSIPVYWRWYSTIGFVRYAWCALMVNQFEDNNPVWTMDGETVLEYYAIKGDKWQLASYLLAFFAVFTLLGYLALSFVRHSRR